MVPLDVTQYIWLGTGTVLVSAPPWLIAGNSALIRIDRNVGFLRYWTVSNTPLFLLAAPMLVLLCYASLWALKMPWVAVKERPTTVLDRTMSPEATDSLLIRLAVPQGLLAVMAFTSYHVQIINRISSGYPLWYWYLVCLVVDRVGESPSAAKSDRLFAMVLQAMVIYGLIQAVLYGSFLPPA